MAYCDHFLWRRTPSRQCEPPEWGHRADLPVSQNSFVRESDDRLEKVELAIEIHFVANPSQNSITGFPIIFFFF